MADSQDSRGAELMRERREAEGLNQTQLAAELETSQPNVSRWESGEYRPPLEIMLKLRGRWDIPLEAWTEPPRNADFQRRTHRRRASQAATGTDGV